MKGLFQSIGLVALVCLSFFYTEKTVMVVREYDDIMISIKKQSDNYKIAPIDAIIDGDTVIPGIKGKKINENKSYIKMKQYGNFNKNFLVFDEVLPSVSLKNNFDKYVIKGNGNKNMISLIFLIKGNDKIDKVLDILKRKKVEANFFIDSNWLEVNEKYLIRIIKEGHTVGSLGNNGNYLDSNYPWVDNKIKTISKKEIGYCYNEIDDIQSLKICSNYNNYTIRPNIIVDKQPLMQVKKNIAPGSIISFKINDSITDELSLIIEYIKSKGYIISTLENHLSE